MQNQIFQSSAKFMHGKIKKKSDTFTYKFSRKYCRFQEAFLAKIIYTKNTLHALNPLISRGNKRSHIL